ncbi:MAG TPA: SCO family protein, partial [Chloroflexota bacterium]|nr:SCO family protein [Chloroflexota bacterium]
MAATAAPPTSARKRRARTATVSAIATAALLVIAGAAFVLTRMNANSSGLIGGMIVTGAPAAPDFTLTDQNGKQVTLSSYHGKTVALTFLYTHCPDVCPLIATTMATADKRLGADQGQLEMLAVSVDPLGDTPPAVLKFDDDRGLTGVANWHYLGGSPAQLEKVWQAYG